MQPHILYLKNILHSSLLHNRCAHKQSTWQGVSCKNMIRHWLTPTLALTTTVLLILSAVCVCSLPRSSGFGQTCSTDTPTDKETRVQLASHGSGKWNRCVRDFDLGEYQMGWRSGGGKRGKWSLPILGNDKYNVKEDKGAGDGGV